MTNCSGKNHAVAAAAWLAYLLATLWVSLALAWKLSAAAGYGYPFWYEHMDIRAHISQYAPQHPYKRGFEQLPPEQHQQAFAQIAHAVHDGGRGLEQIRYSGPDGESVLLLDAQEVGHLRDVAHLLDKLDMATLLVLPIWLLAALLVGLLGSPSRRARWLAVATLGAGIALPLLWWGPKAVFYWFHEWVFPPEHPWFFYWNESLMSALMKAPYLFGGIAIMLVMMAGPLCWGFYMLGNWLARNILARGMRGRN